MIHYVLITLCLATALDDDKDPQTRPEPCGSQPSIPDEDPMEEIVHDLNVLAEVTLPKKPSAYFISTMNLLVLIMLNRIYMGFVEGCRAAHFTVISPSGPGFSGRPIKCRSCPIISARCHVSAPYKSVHILCCDRHFSCTK